MLHLAGHHRLGDAGLLQQADARAQLPERDPVDRRAPALRGRVVQLGERFFLDRDDGDVVALRARGVEDEERKPAVAGDETELIAVMAYLVRSTSRFLGPPRSRGAG